MLIILQSLYFLLWLYVFISEIWAIFLFSCLFEAWSMEHGDIKEYSYEQLKGFTDDFSDEKFLGYFQFGEVYHGVIKEGEQHQHVMVKVWEVPEDFHYYSGDIVLRLTVCCSLA